MIVPTVLSFISSCVQCDFISCLEISNVCPFVGHILVMVSRALEYGDWQTLGTGLETLACLARAPTGETLLLSSKERVAGLCRQVLTTTSQTPDVKAMCLDLITALLAPLPGDDIGAAQQPLFEALESALGASSLYDYLHRAVKMPFSEISLAGLRGLEALSLTHWGRQYLCRQGGFVELIADRRTESSRDQLSWKLSTAKAIVSDLALGLPSDAVLLLKFFLRDRYAPLRDPAAVVESSSM